MLGSVYGGLGVAQAVQNAMNKIWGVPRSARPNPLEARGISLLLLLVVSAGILLTTVLSALSITAQAYGAVLGAGSRTLTSLAAVVVNALLFIFAFRILTARQISTRQVRAGAIAAAITWQLLQVVGTYAVGHALKGAGATYGVFGLVLGLIAWIYVGAVTVVLAAEVNVVRASKFSHAARLPRSPTISNSRRATGAPTPPTRPPSNTRASRTSRWASTNQPISSRPAQTPNPDPSSSAAIPARTGVAHMPGC